MKKDTLYEKHLKAVDSNISADIEGSVESGYSYAHVKGLELVAKASTNISIEYAKEECLKVLNFIYNNERLFSDSGDPNEIYEEYIKSILP